jgi:hypothetical protein
LARSRSQLLLQIAQGNAIYSFGILSDSRDFRSKEKDLSSETSYLYIFFSEDEAPKITPMKNKKVQPKKPASSSSDSSSEDEAAPKVPQKKKVAAKPASSSSSSSEDEAPPAKKSKAATPVAKKGHSLLKAKKDSSSSESSSEDEAATKKAPVKPKVIRKSVGKPPASSSSEDEAPPAKTPSKAKFGAVPPPDFGTPVRIYTFMSKFEVLLFKMTKSTPAVKKSNLKTPGKTPSGNGLRLLKMVYIKF